MIWYSSKEDLNNLGLSGQTSRKNWTFQNRYIIHICNMKNTFNKMLCTCAKYVHVFCKYSNVNLMTTYFVVYFGSAEE